MIYEHIETLKRMINFKPSNEVLTNYYGPLINVMSDENFFQLLASTNLFLISTKVSLLFISYKMD